MAIKKDTNQTKKQIKDHARKLFLKKGFRSVTVRDIAKASGTNIALISYYFGNKEQLHKEILSESLELFRTGLYNEIHNSKNSLNDKLNNITRFYIDTLATHPDLSAFVMNALRTDPKKYSRGLEQQLEFRNSVLSRQIQKEFGHKKPFSALHILVNLYALIVFPYTGKEMIRQMGSMKKNDFEKFLSERKKMIPLWVSAMLSVKTESTRTPSAKRKI